MLNKLIKNITCRRFHLNPSKSELLFKDGRNGIHVDLRVSIPKFSSANGSENGKPCVIRYGRGIKLLKKFVVA